MKVTVYTDPKKKKNGTGKTGSSHDQGTDYYTGRDPRRLVAAKGKPSGNVPGVAGYGTGGSGSKSTGGVGTATFGKKAGSVTFTPSKRKKKYKKRY